MNLPPSGGARRAAVPRRTALLRLGLGILAGLWSGVSCARRPRDGAGSGGIGARPEAVSPDAALALEQDMERLSRRVYAEEGVPVFLVGENLAPGRPAGSRGTNPAAEGAAWAAEFDRQVQLWKRLRPNRSADDVPKLIEVLADRDLQARQSGGHR